MESGFFQLKNPNDLFSKLEWEYGNLRTHPGDARHAFNFFVTAEHIPDWKNCKKIKSEYPLLALCSQIANGGKHFEANKVDRKTKEKLHKSAKSAKHNGVFEHGVYEEGVFEESLQITLEADAAADLHFQTIDAVSLASKVLEFWRERI